MCLLEFSVESAYIWAELPQHRHALIVVSWLSSRTEF